jgi:hypothetical protein
MLNKSDDPPKGACLLPETSKLLVGIEIQEVFNIGITCNPGATIRIAATG